jgi:hypothetical protein
MLKADFDSEVPKLAELRTDLPDDSHPGEFCFAPGSRNWAGLAAKGRFRPEAEVGVVHF